MLHHHCQLAQQVELAAAAKVLKATTVAATELLILAAVQAQQVELLHTAVMVVQALWFLSLQTL
jgi:UDP-N-acetylglucosamine enolpyruvyl transferase